MLFYRLVDLVTLVQRVSNRKNREGRRCIFPLLRMIGLCRLGCKQSTQSTLLPHCDTYKLSPEISPPKIQETKGDTDGEWGGGEAATH